MSVHRIRLSGPWQWLPDESDLQSFHSRAADTHNSDAPGSDTLGSDTLGSDTPGSDADSARPPEFSAQPVQPQKSPTADLTRSGPNSHPMRADSVRCQLPFRLGDGVGSAIGTQSARLCRRFHQPSGLSTTSVVRLVLCLTNARASLMVNGFQIDLTDATASDERALIAESADLKLREAAVSVQELYSENLVAHLVPFNTAEVWLRRENSILCSLDAVFLEISEAVAEEMPSPHRL